LARETKQALAYAEIGTALVERRPVEGDVRLDTLGPAMLKVVNHLVLLTGFTYEGLDAVSWEPMFRSREGARVPFDGLPTRVRHLTAFGALAVRTLWAAYPDRDPRISEGVVLIDEVDLHQDVAVALKLPAALRAALPSVQWILTTCSPIVASGASTGEVLALRASAEGRVELHAGLSATTH
jgi:hypothetical protein